MYVYIYIPLYIILYIFFIFSILYYFFFFFFNIFKENIIHKAENVISKKFYNKNMFVSYVT